MYAREESLWRRQAFGVRSRQINDQAHHGLPSEVAATNAEPVDFDQAGQFMRRPHHSMPLTKYSQAK